MNRFSVIIQHKINETENADKARWLENYVKHDIKSLGVGIPEIREILIAANKEWKLSEMPLPQQEDMLDDLMRQEFTEHKLAGILYIQRFWKNVSPAKLLCLISAWFENNLISDWNVCDWLCVRLLSPMIDTNPEPTLVELTKWNSHPSIWKSRASLVPFAQCKTIGKYEKEIHDFSATLIMRQERFCKTAVGWVLRELSKTDAQFVTTFLNDFEPFVTKEVYKNATKYLAK